MRKEKIIMVAFFIISGIVVLETSYTLFLKPTKINPEKHTRTNTNFYEVRQKKDSSRSPSLSVSGWSRDIFYDRSSIYDNWFSLTGITEFDNGRKAIINDEILRVGEKVRGFTVNDISENQVFLSKNKYQVTLNLEQ